MLALLVAAPVSAQTVTTSPAPDAVSVTVYRDPDRSADRRMNLRWLNGYALIAEQRTIAVPAGEADIRFEGVAGGIIPESAIVTGLPDGVIEKNQDAWLLSPASLLDASLGRRVHIRRTSAATGAVSETEAVILSGKDGAVVLETPAGFEALRCTGLPETLIYDEVPEGLSAKPTLSVRTRSASATRAVVTLSYLATGFDWQADYVAELSPDGESIDLFAWMTIANGDETGFVEAGTQAVAGQPNRERTYRRAPVREPIRLRCWPQYTTTSDLRSFASESADLIVVTGSRISVAAPPPPPPPPAPPAMVAEQEELGDLKLYRIPEPVTVAANSQKQVAMIVRPRVPVEIVYRIDATGEGIGGAIPIVTTRNREVERLGLPLPAGRIALFGEAEGRRILVGRGHLDDRAIGEDVEIALGRSIDVQTVQTIESRTKDRRTHRLIVTNAKPHPIRFEAEIFAAGRVKPRGVRLARRDGRPLWAVTVPANGSAELRYTVREPD